MTRNWFTPLAILICALMSACSSLPLHQPTVTPTSQPPMASPPQNTHINKAPDSEAEVVKHKLYQQYNVWKDVKYRMGGLSKNGVDCSGLVYTTYREQFELVLPRTTELQARTGREVQKHQLQPGDLVFFKTKVKVRHVGIYIEDGDFLHASTKKGVMISNLDDYYWSGRFWHARRVR